MSVALLPENGNPV